jgi:tetratricopeptide (TPR) repeat protein
MRPRFLVRHVFCNSPGEERLTGAHLRREAPESLSLSPLQVATMKPAQPADRQVLLSLAMIVRDGGLDLPRCLASAIPWVDEMVVVDTGSTDGTPAAAADAGAVVLHRRWDDDFAAARTAALEACCGPWILVLDADEALAPADGRTLRDWVEAADLHGRCVGAELPTRNYQTQAAGQRGWLPVPADDPHALPGGPPAPGYVITRKVRVFPNRKEVRFEGCLHELVEPSLRRAGGAVEPLEVPIHHFGTLHPDPEKLRRYLRLARRKTAQHPRNPQAWAELADCQQNLGRCREALAALEVAVALAPDDLVHALKSGLLLGELERWGAAIRQLTRVIEAPRVISSQRAEALHMRGLIALKRNRPAEAGPDLQRALELAPDQGLYWNSLGAWHLLSRRGEEALAALERAQQLLPGHPDPPLNLGILYAAAGQPELARPQLERALAADPGCAEARRRLAQLVSGATSPR